MVAQSPQNSSSSQESEISQTQAERIILKNFLLNALNANAERYPWLVNNSDRLIIEPSNYNLQNANTQINFDLNLSETAINGENQRFNEPIVNNLNFSRYQDDQQFYWILNNNRVVIETKGVHGNFDTQGRSTEQTSTQVASVTQGFFGVQAVWALPNEIPALRGEEKFKEFSTTTIAAEIVNDEDAPPLGLSIDLGIDLDDPQVIILDDLNKGNTFAEEGGGSFFDNLDADNAPIFLQGFHTVNLQPLLANGTALQEGETVPRENLEEAGIILGEFFTGAGGSFPLTFSSFQGVYPLRLNTDANEDLVKVLTNPFLSQEERNFHYLNSLLWFGFDQRQPDFFIEGLGTNSNAEETSWKRWTTSFSHNRTLLFYHPEEIRLDYTNLFSNPGLSITFSNFNNADGDQVLNATVGLLAGKIFDFIPAADLNDSLERGKEKFENLERLGALNTQATSQQRRQMNVRLNSTLRSSSSSSSLRQVSGSWTFSGTTTPNNSQLWQVRTGLYRRGVQFFAQQVGEFGPENPVFFSRLRLNNETFGPLTFRGQRFPIDATPITPLNRTVAVTTVVRTPDGETLVSNQSSRPLDSTTTVPLIEPDKPFDLAFDLIEITRTRRREIESQTYTGYLYVPALEFALSGSERAFNYSIVMGGWVNFASSSAPGVEENQASQFNEDSLTVEPGSGAYAKGDLNFIWQDVGQNDQGEVVEVVTHVPFVSLSWNTGANRLNSNFINVGYQLAWRNRHLGFSIVPSLYYAPQATRQNFFGTIEGEQVTNLATRFFTQGGFEVNFNLEFATNNRLEVEAKQRLFENEKSGTLSVGTYYSNFNTFNQGLSSRIEDNRYGLIADYTFPDQTFTVNSRFGHSGSGFELELQGQSRF